MNPVITGLDRIRQGQWRKLEGYRLGLLSNQASLDSRLHSAKEVVSECLPGHLKALFGPQHGYGGEDQDNMVETAHGHDRGLDIPVFSLYAEKREPLPQMLDMIDILLVDLQDVGTRVYTFASTMLHCMRSAAKLGKKVIVLDRPNPLGGELVEGNLLRPELYSFVGPYQLPMRHGLTMGEMALLFDDVFDLACDLEVIPMEGWHRGMLWKQTGLRWIMPSPNMPTADTSLVYPGQVIWEGTNLSEGRGTCRPFELFGAPFFGPGAIAHRLEPEATAGCFLQPFSFRPTFHKWEGRLCRGFMIHVVDPNTYRPLLCSIALLRAVMDLHGKDFRWKEPPYEYEHRRRPIDLILGDSSLPAHLEEGLSLHLLKERWLQELNDYLHWRRPYLLYS